VFKNGQTITFLQVLFQGAQWLRSWALLQRIDGHKAGLVNFGMPTSFFLEYAGALHINSIKEKKVYVTTAAGHTGIAMGYIIIETTNDWNMMP
jgi:hypothetical protein